MSNICKFSSFRSENYLSAYDSTTQTISSATEAFSWKFNTIDISRGITITDLSKITFSQKGIYNIQFSAQLKTTTGSDTIVYIWPRKNGVNIPYSNTVYDIKGGGKAEVAVLNYLLSLEKDDFVEIMWSDSTTTTLASETSSNNPLKPEIPSVILTVWGI